jgi:Putative peptidoglycan binding domain
MRRKRINVLLAVVAFMILVMVGGWIAILRIDTPAEVAARTAPPTPSPILVPVEERVLSSNIVTRGTARFGLPQVITIAPSNLKGQPGLITTLPLPNSQLNEGDVLLTDSGRPVFLLQGSTPAYRDLVPDISGNDVRQLEQALQRLGFDPGPVDGTYDQATSAAVAAWYKAGSWEPFGPTKEQLASNRTLERDLAEARKNQAAAEGAVKAAALSVESARATAEHSNRQAAAEVASKAAERDLVVLDPRQSKTAREAADANYKQAQSGVTAAEVAGNTAIQAAIETQKVAELDAQLAAERAERLAEEYDIAQRKLGFQVPADEIVFLPALPARVKEVTAVVGDAVHGPVLSVTDNQLAVDSSLPLDAAQLVKSGMQVTIDEQSLGIKASGTVSKVAPSPGTHGVDGYHIYFEVRVDKTSAPFDGFSVRLTIPIQSTHGKVTVVPVSALSLAADGTSRVQVESTGTLEYVQVEPGMAADGFVEVRPVQGSLTPGQLVVIGYENP